MVKSTEEKLGEWIQAATNIAQDHEVRLDKLEKLVEALCIRSSRVNNEVEGVERVLAGGVVEDHVRLRRCKAELAELEGK